MIYAYGDDGSDARRERVTAVSIVAGYEEWWQDLEEQWIVRCGGIPFHATDCESDQGDYKNVPHSDNKATYRDLTGIVATSKVGGIGVGIDLLAQKKILPGALPIAYFRAFTECLIRVANVAERLDEICEVTYDIGDDNEYNASQMYACLRESEERFYRLLHPKISFVHWRQSARVQVADLLAYEAWKALDHTVGEKKRTRKSWELLRATERFETLAYSADWFNDLKTHYLETGILEQKVGFKQSDYMDWLQHRHQKHNLSNLICFLRSRNDRRSPEDTEQP